jgi:hypothetical protein
MNITELEKLAKAALALDHNEYPHWYASDYICKEGAHYIKNANFISACDPQTIIQLIELLREMGEALEAMVSYASEEGKGLRMADEVIAKYKEMTK